MSQRQSEDVSKIVENYRTNYPQAERQVIKKAILQQYPQLNTRTLDRHLKKAFETTTIQPKIIEKEAPLAITEPCLPEESELDKARAISMMQACQALGFPLSKEDWAYVLNQNDGKRMLEKARALIQLRGTQALL